MDWIYKIACGRECVSNISDQSLASVLIELRDSEIFRIFHEQEARATEVLLKYRPALELVAEALLERETIDGAEVAQLVQASLDHVQVTEDAHIE